MKQFLSLMALAVGLSAPVAFAAEDMYRSVMPDGSIRYGELPDPRAKSVRKVAPPPPATGVITIRPEERNAPLTTSGGPAVSVVPEKQRPTTPAAQAGTLQAPDGLPKRPY